MSQFYTSTDHFTIIPAVMLALFGCAILLFDFLIFPDPRQRKWLLIFVALAEGFTGFALYRQHAWLAANGLTELTGFQGSVTIDGFGIFFNWIFLIAAMIVAVVSYKYLEIAGEHHGEYYGLILFAQCGMFFLATGTDLITLFIGLELMALTFYVMVGFLRTDKRSNEAALKYLLLGAFSSGFLVYGFSVMYGLAGSTKLSAVLEAVGQRPPWDPVVFLALATTSVGLLFKISAVPFHMWAPDAYEGAPTTVTAYLAVASKAASIAFLLRIFTGPLWPAREVWEPILAVVAVLTMTVGNLAAINQRAAEQPDHVGQHGQQRHHQRRRQQSREHQEAHRVEAEGDDRVDFLVHLLSPDLSGEGRAGAPGEHDGGHQRPKLARHGNADAVDDEDHGAELLCHEADLECDDHTHQEADQQDDRHGVGARLGGHRHDFSPADGAGIAQCMPEGGRALAEEDGHGHDVGDHLGRCPAEVLGDADGGGPTIGLYEVLRVVALDQRREVWSEVLDLHFGSRRPRAAPQVEQQRDARIVNVLESGGVDDDAAVGITRQRLERGTPDRRYRVSRDPALQGNGRGISSSRAYACDRHGSDSQTGRAPVSDLSAGRRAAPPLVHDLPTLGRERALRIQTPTPAGERAIPAPLQGRQYIHLDSRLQCR